MGTTEAGCDNHLGGDRHSVQQPLDAFSPGHLRPGVSVRRNKSLDACTAFGYNSPCPASVHAEPDGEPTGIEARFTLTSSLSNSRRPYRGGFFLYRATREVSAPREGRPFRAGTGSPIGEARRKAPASRVRSARPAGSGGGALHRHVWRPAPLRVASCSGASIDALGRNRRMVGRSGDHAGHARPVNRTSAAPPCGRAQAAQA